MNITISCLVVPNRPYARSSSSIIDVAASRRSLSGSVGALLLGLPVLDAGWLFSTENRLFVT